MYRCLLKQSIFLAVSILVLDLGPCDGFLFPSPSTVAAARIHDKNEADAIPKSHHYPEDNRGLSQQTFNNVVIMSSSNRPQSSVALKMSSKDDEDGRQQQTASSGNDVGQIVVDDKEKLPSVLALALVTKVLGLIVNAVVFAFGYTMYIIAAISVFGVFLNLSGYGYQVDFAHLHLNIDTLEHFHTQRMFQQVR